MEWARQGNDLRILVICDHATPVRVRTHVRGPVPFVLWGPGIEPSGAQAYCERDAAGTGVRPADGRELMRLLFSP